MICKNTVEMENLKKAARSALKNEFEQLLLVSPVTFNLLNIADDDISKIEDLSRFIENDPALSAKILQNVNSAAIGLPKQITSIRRAVTLLGISAIRRISLALVLYNRLIKPDPKQSFDRLLFWQHCLFVASLSRNIAIALEHPNPDLLYTAGLLHDIGKIVLETHGKLSYSDFVCSLEKNWNPTLDEERQFFGATHTEIGHLLCVEWHLSPSIAAVVAHHHQLPEQSSTYYEFQREIAIVSFANYLAWMHGLSSIKTESPPALQKQVFEFINIDQIDLEGILQKGDDDMIKSQELFGITYPRISRLRAALLKTSLNLSQLSNDNFQQTPYQNETWIPSSLTKPHESLDPNQFIPLTLDAIRRDFGFDRVILFTINSERRTLISSYQQFDTPLPVKNWPIEINIDTVSGLLIRCLREKFPVVINNETEPNNPILKLLNTSEFIAVPLLQHRRPAGIIYADHFSKPTATSQRTLSQMVPVAHQLGVALLNAKRFQSEKKRAQLDPLTQLLNKRMIDQSLTKIFQLSGTALESVAIGFVDIDNFKLFNDRCGHQAGDEAIRIVSNILKRFTRAGDIIGRYGGEEFLFVLNDTNKISALGYAERIRSEIEQSGKTMSPRFKNMKLTVSIGISLYCSEFSDFTDMIEVADQAMYKAKNEGRNRVVLLETLASPKIAADTGSFRVY